MKWLALLAVWMALPLSGCTVIVAGVDEGCPRSGYYEKGKMEPQVWWAEELDATFRFDPKTGAPRDHGHVYMRLDELEADCWAREKAR